MVNINMEVRGLEETVAVLHNIEHDVDDLYFRFLNETAEAIIEKARANLSENDSIITGELSNSIRVLDSGQADGGGYVTVGTDVFYAIYVEYGRGPIRPVTAKVLHWIDKKTGKDVFASYAGPAEARPFFEPAVLAVRKKFEGLLAEKMNQFVRGAATKAGAPLL